MPGFQVRSSAGGQLRALLLSLPAVAIPVAGVFLFPESRGEYEALLWLLALVPAFLLAHQRGWRGVATALALGMAVLSVTYGVATIAGATVPGLLFGVVVAYIAIALGVGWLAEGVAARHDAETRASLVLRDPLTELPNRRHAESFLGHEFAAAARGRALTVLLIDIDHFHQFNVRNGRAAGDGVLRAVATVLRQHTRRMNLSARYGPDEFICLLGGTDEAGALTVATRIQERLRAAASTVALPTLSIGIATWAQQLATPEELLRAAEDALLAAKQHGRDRVRIHGRGAEELAALRAEVAGAAAYADPLLVALSPAAPARGIGAGHVALVVDGQEETRSWLSQWLRERGFEVRAVADAEAAISTLPADCALALVALTTGGSAAADLLGELRRRAPGIRIVGLPRPGAGGVTSGVLAVRVDAHVLPDQDPAALEQEIRALLEERATELDALVVSRQVTDELRASAREARLALAQSEARYREVVQTIQQVICSADRDGRWTFLNPAWSAITGFNVEESLGTPLWDYVHPDERAAVREEYARLLERRAAHQVLEARWQTRAGDNRWIELRLQVQTDAAGAVIGASGVLTDVTDRRRAEEALRRNEEYFRLLIENSADMIAVVNQDRSVRYVSPAVERVLGYEAAAWRELVTTTLLHPDDVAAANGAFAAVLADPATTHSVRLRIRHRDDSWRTLEVVLRNQLAAAGVEGVVVNARDVTARVQAETALQHSSELVARARRMESIGRLAGGIAHDFNNLLTAIQGRAALLIDEVAESSGLRGDLLEIRDAAERASGLTRQLLAFSRRQVLQLRVLDVNLVVADMERMLQRTIGEHITLSTELQATPGLVRADPGQLEQVLLNLVVNARDALPAGGHIRLRTATRTIAPAEAVDDELAPGEYVLLQVEDDGTGMSRNVAQQAFEPFFTTKQPGAGSGLGLSTAYGVIKQSGGHITLTSTPGVGTTATILLPRAAETPAAAARPPQPVPATRGGETVLLAEDEKSVRELTRRILEKSGYRVLAASNGREALELQAAHAGPIELLLTDVVMPEMAGPELADRLAELRPETEVLFMSGYAEEAISAHGALAGRPLLEKPFAPHELLQRVRAALAYRG